MYTHMTLYYLYVSNQAFWGTHQRWTYVREAYLQLVECISRTAERGYTAVNINDKKQKLF